MKRILYGTTAMVAAGMLMGGTAYAQAKPVELKIGGYFDAAYSFVDQDDGLAPASTLGARRDHDLFTEKEVHFKGSMTLDNGLQVGISYEIEMADCADIVDESYLWFSSQFGRLEIGETDGVAKKMGYSQPVAIPEFGHHDRDFQDWNSPALVPSATALLNTVVEAMGSDVEKINFFTPRIAGVQLGVSYAPRLCKEGNVAPTSAAAVAGSCGGVFKGQAPEGASVAVGGIGTQTGDAYQDNWGIAANFVQKFGGLDVAVYAGWEGGTLENSAGFTSLDDRETWGFGASLSMMGITVGGAYRDDNLGNLRNNRATGADTGLQSDLKSWNIGARYVMGPWGVGFEYGQARVDDGPGTEDEVDQLSIGATYTLGPGVTLFGGVAFFEANNGVATIAGVNQNNEGSAWRLGTKVSF
jgi:outer membrane protein OmpU